VLIENKIVAPVACPLCGGTSERLFEKRGYWLRDCAVCGHRFLEFAATDHVAHAATIYGDEYFFGSEQGYPDYLAQGDVLRAHGKRYGRMLARYGKLGSVLDVGTAGGFILAGLQDAGWCGAGVEPNATMAGYARMNLGLEVVRSTLEEADDHESYDAITMIQVIMQFVDPFKALRRASSLTKAGGLLLVETWLRDSLTARLFGSAWHAYNPPSMLHWFTAESLAHLGGRCGYQFVARGRPRKSVIGAHVKNALRLAFGEGSFAKVVRPLAGAVPDGATVPYPAEDMIWMLFRKS
jgi:SAM-dependent methyltransferase